MAKKSILQEAIAEARTVREAAIKNACKELEETLTPSIKEMLASKLEEEIDLNEEDEESIEENANSGFKEVKVKQPKKLKESEEDTDEEEPAEDAEEPSEEPDGDEEGGEAEGDHEEPDGDEPVEEEGPSDDTNISDLTLGDLRNLISDMVSQIAANPAPEGDMGADMDAGDVQGVGDEEPLDVDPDANATNEPGADAGAPENDEEIPDNSEDDDEIDISEILKELEDEESKDPNGKYVNGSNSQDKEKPCNESKELVKTKKELAEALGTVKELRNTLADVNLLNSKLLYTSRMLSKPLSESQKVKVIRSFDKAASPREVKVVYNTLMESFSAAKKAVVKEHKGSASRPAGKSTAAPKSVIVEADETVKRLQRLAGIIND